jgi:hypothetical protein
VARRRELVTAISLARDAPRALAKLKATGTCVFPTPESLFDEDTPGHFFRRITEVAVTIPAVEGPYTGMRCVLTLLGRSPVRQVVTSSDPGGSDRFLPFEGAGVVSTWQLDIPPPTQQFDYDRIADVIVHLRCTADAR